MLTCTSHLFAIDIVDIIPQYCWPSYFCPLFLIRTYHVKNVLLSFSPFMKIIRMNLWPILAIFAQNYRTSFHECYARFSPRQESIKKIEISITEVTISLSQYYQDMFHLGWIVGYATFMSFLSCFCSIFMSFLSCYYSIFRSF